jgi:hypothetical protein
MSRRKRVKSPQKGHLSVPLPRSRHWKIVAASAISAVLAAAAVILSPLGGGVSGLTSGGSTPALTAAIIDQLSLTAPNPEFAEAAMDTLEKAGYTADYFPGEEVTVEFYRTLPQRNYDLIIFRTHSTAVISRGDESVSTVSFFTNEPYSRSRYYDEQAAGRLGFASYTDGGDQLFGITAAFVRDSMQGDFGGATVIMMGCDGLKNDEAAKAFLTKGASSYTSWSEFVTASHTDAATERLLSYFVTEKIPLPEAVARTNDELGPDPTFGSELLYRLD